METVVIALLIFVGIIAVVFGVKLIRIGHRANQSLEKWLESKP